MPRRAFLRVGASLPLFWALPSFAAAKPYEARFFSAGFDGANHLGGLHLTMNPGWKTYWRVPGDGGIPPSIEAKGGNIAAFSFACPVPRRIASEGGEAIGYTDEVVFPWTLRPADVAKPVTAALSAFLGVCETVCIPVPVTGDLVLQPVGAATRDTGLLASWQARVPTETKIISAVAAGEDGQIFIDVDVAEAVRDIFVEGSALHFFLAPSFDTAHRRARLVVHGAKSASELRNKPLRMTLVTMNGTPAGGLEQTVTVR